MSQIIKYILYSYSLYSSKLFYVMRNRVLYSEIYYFIFSMIFLLPSTYMLQFSTIITVSSITIVLYCIHIVCIYCHGCRNTIQFINTSYSYCQQKKQFAGSSTQLINSRQYMIHLCCLCNFNIFVLMVSLQT